MKRKIRDFLLYRTAVDFGKCKLSSKERAFYRSFNNEIFSLARSLPESTQTDSILFLMRYAGVALGNEPDFFANYYSPAWSIIYWLGRDNTLPTERLTPGDVKNAVTGHAMAMFLHSLDDHLSDGQISVSPLTLLLRSQAWTILNRAFRNLAQECAKGEQAVQSHIDEYYSSQRLAQPDESIDDYCNLFRKQMAIGFIAPILLAMKMNGISGFTQDIVTAYGSFGVAWRLLDDIKDIIQDIEKGTRTAIYFYLPKKLRTNWDNNAGESRGAAKGSDIVLLERILEHGVIEKTKERICAELDTAANMVEAYNMTGFGRELRCLAQPLLLSAD
jgi:hypothetical protein